MIAEPLIRTVLDNAPIVLFSFDKNGIFTVSEGQGLKGLHRKPGEVVGKSVFDLYKDYPKIIETVRKALAGEVVSSIQQVDHLWFDSWMTPIFDSAGQVSGAMGVATDVTHLKNAELALQTCQTAMEGAMDGMAIVGPDGNYVFMNKSHADVFGYETPQELIGKSWRLLYDDEELKRFDEVRMPEFMQTRRWHGETKARKKDGSLFDQEVSLTAIGEHGIICICRDVTARKYADEELKKASIELKRSNDELEQFAAIASHDLKEPLRAVSIYAELLSNRYKGKLDPQGDGFIRGILEGVDRMQALINALLEYGRAGSVSLQEDEIDCDLLLQNVTADFQDIVQKTNAKLRWSHMPTVIADRVLLTAVFQNLISNALKFRSAESPMVLISAQHTNEGWTFSVKDNGIGFKPEYQPRIFEIFQRLHTNEEYPGTGIGLAVCKRSLERHGGHIWAESMEGAGATFYFSLPKRPIYRV